MNPRDRGADPAWVPFAFFDGDDRCVAAIEVAGLTLLIDGHRRQAAGLKAVAVDPAWRGRGLARRLIEDALVWCAARGDGPVLLYAEEQALYGRYGFAAVPQHAFEGPAPVPIGSKASRRLDLARDTDRALSMSFLTRRTAVSWECALVGGMSLFLENVESDPDLEVVHCPALDALVVTEGDDETLTLVDIVAPAIPRLDALLGALGRRPARIRTLFPADRLGWTGTPVPDDPGLMLRGPVPIAMRRPFMLPPTTEF